MRPFKLLIFAICALGSAGAMAAQEQDAAAPTPITYADLVALSDPSQLVLRAQIKRQIALEPERSTGVAAGFVRLYIEAETLALLAGNTPVGESLRYLVDVPLDPGGKVPKLKKQEVLLFARAVPSRPGELQLVNNAGQQLYSAALEARLRDILRDLASPDAPPVVTGVRDALSVAGNLVGESETQIFLETQSGAPVSITVLRRPGRPPAWGVSWGEIIDQSARPPEPESIEWYRLACALPSRLPEEANLAQGSAVRALAARDYALVMGALGPCARTVPGD